MIIVVQTSLAKPLLVSNILKLLKQFTFTLESGKSITYDNKDMWQWMHEDMNVGQWHGTLKTSIETRFYSATHNCTPPV